MADLGAGTGRDAEQLLAALPRGRVPAIDGSRQMLAQLRDRLAGHQDRLQVLEADLREPLPVTEPVDAVLSVATLHWLPDHAQVFRSAAGILRPGGQFAAEAGGAGTSAPSGPPWLSWAPTMARTSGTSRGRGSFVSAWRPLASPGSRSAWSRARPGSNRPTSSRRSWPPWSWVRTCASAARRAPDFVRAVAARLGEPVVQLRPAADPRHPGATVLIMIVEGRAATWRGGST